MHQTFYWFKTVILLGLLRNTVITQKIRFARLIARKMVLTVKLNLSIINRKANNQQLNYSLRQILDFFSNVGQLPLYVKIY